MVVTPALCTCLGRRRWRSSFLGGAGHRTTSIFRRGTIVPPTLTIPPGYGFALSELLNLKQNVLVAHPSGSESFGTIPDISKFELPGGEIYLRVGVHIKDNRGFGIRHIWEAHQPDLAKYGCETIDGVAQHVANMIVPGAAIYCEFREMRGNHRLTVMKTPTGSLVLEPRNERRGFGYYVVTWYPKRRLDGTLVGRVARPLKQE